MSNLIQMPDVAHGAIESKRTGRKSRQAASKGETVTTETIETVDSEVATIAIPDAPADGEDSGEQTAEAGEVITPLERLVANEKVIDRGLKAYEKKSAEIEGTKEEVGAALYEIYNDKLWKARKDKQGKALFKNFGEYLESRGWDKTASRAFQLMADHRKALKAANEPVVESKRGPKPNNPGRSAQTVANQIINLRTSLSQRAEQMTGESQAENDFVDIAERFIEATAEFVSEFEALADRERGSETA